MIENIYILWNIDADNIGDLEKEIAQNNLEIEILKPVDFAVNLFGHKFLWQINLKFQDEENKKELEFFKNKIARKEFLS